MQLSAPFHVILLNQGGAIMRPLGKIAAALGVVGVIGVSGVVPAAADLYGRHHHPK